MTFTVTYRGADGAVRECQMEAAGRWECIAQCRVRGIAPVSVKENAPTRMRKPTEQTRVVHGQSMPDGKDVRCRSNGASRVSPLNLALTAALILLLGGGVWWWKADRGGTSPSDEGMRKRTALLPKEVKPAKPNVAATPSAVTNAISEAVVQKEPPKPLLTRDERIDKIEKKILETPLDLSVQTNRAFRTGLEQSLAAIFSTPLGAPPPMIPTRMAPVTLVHLQQILDAPNEILETDSEKVVEAKMACAAAKKEMKAYMDGGGDPEKFLEHYHSILQQANGEWRAAQFKLIETMKNDPSLAPTMEAEINENFKARGIRPIRMPPGLKERYGIE